ncbi:MAG: hypothetical protein FLDDKLPJ_03227 [Phycisphaerae bacterium]|nr:hypothetical protein [Phycisphaerae bacterium]
MTRQMRVQAGAGLAAVMTVLTGCASLDDLRTTQRANNNLTAQNERLEQELQDCRSSVDLLNARLDAAEDELNTKRELVASLEAENNLLHEKIRLAEKTLDDLGKMPAGDLVVGAPKLPEPLDSALKALAAQHPDAITFDSTRGFVKWKGDLLFDLGSDVVRDSAKDGLRGFAEIVNSAAASGFEVVIVGHTCTTPIKRSETLSRHPTNWHLSAHRSIAVADVLMQYGCTGQRVGVMGYGEFRPIADNGNDSGKSQNRRVEVYLVEQGTLFAMGDVLNAELAGGVRFAAMGD